MVLIKIPVHLTSMNESEIQKAIIGFLDAKGWNHQLVVHELHVHGVDIIVRDNNNKHKARYLFIECKGESTAKSSKSINETMWLYALGQLVSRMKGIAKNAYLYGLGLPETSAKIAIRRIPWQIARHLSLRIFSVDSQGKVTEFTPRHLKALQFMKPGAKRL